jgi:hypothetical protein
MTGLSFLETSTWRRDGKHDKFVSLKTMRACTIVVEIELSNYNLASTSVCVLDREILPQK